MKAKDRKYNTKKNYHTQTPTPPVKIVIKIDKQNNQQC